MSPRACCEKAVVPESPLARSTPSASALVRAAASAARDGSAAADIALRLIASNCWRNVAETFDLVISVTSSAVVRGPGGRDAAFVASGKGFGRMIGMLEGSTGSALDRLIIA